MSNPGNDYNPQAFQSVGQSLEAASADLARNGAGDVAAALVNNGLGEPQDLNPVDEYRTFIHVWATQLAAEATELAAYARLCQTMATALTADDNATASALGQ